MSARVESPPIGGSFAAPILMAILVALGVGALLGAVVTKAVNDRPSGLAPARAIVATPVGTAPWDTQKLEAMQGRLNRLIRAARFPEPGSERSYPWPPV